MSRKFTDSEVRAYSKNRYEEKVLKCRLEKLKEDIGTFHDLTAKQRQDLVEECKVIRKTTGGSPIPDEFFCDENFDVSNRVMRPWAYSVMDSTYNVAYQDAVIPMPRKKKKRPKSEITPRVVLTRSTASVYSDKTHDKRNSRKSPSTTFLSVASNSDIVVKDFDRPSSSGKGSSHSHPKSRHSEDASHKPNSASTAQRDTFTPTEQSDKSKTVPNIVLENRERIPSGRSSRQNQHNGIFLTAVPSESIESSTDELRDIPKQNLLSPRVDEDALMRSVAAPVFLPPVYKIDSQSNQEAVRSRAAHRSKSRVSFSSAPAAPEKTSHASKERGRAASPETSGDGIPRGDKSQPSSSPRNAHHPVDQEVANFHEHNHMDRANTIVTLDPDAYHDVNLRKMDDTLYKGLRLKNYIHPEDRYKLDPLVMKRRQNKMDRLAKESVSFLKKVNHENIKVEIAFPRSERKRILMKLVEQNCSGRSKKLDGDDTARIQKKIECFMSSITDYIRQQHFEREHTYA